MSPTKCLIGTTLREKITVILLAASMLISSVAVGFVSAPVGATTGHPPSTAESITDTTADTNIPNTANETNRSEVHFEITNLTPQTRDITVALDDTLAFMITVENTGEAKGTQTVEFRIDDDAVASQNVTLDVNDSTTVEFDEINVSHFDTGEYEYGFFTNDDNRTATITFQPAGDDRVVVDRVDSNNGTDGENDVNGSDGNEEREEATNSDTPGFGAPAALVALVVATLFVARPSKYDL